MAEPQQTNRDTINELRRKLSESEAEKRQMGSQLTAQSIELIEAKDKLAEVTGLLKDMTAARDEALSLLRELADHTAGRDGMLAKSKKFCGCCGNPISCVLPRVYTALEATEEYRATGS